MLRSSKVKITCFYCNQPSYIPRTGNASPREFDCPRCYSTNKFDENGQILDYHPDVEQPFVKFARDNASPKSKAHRHVSVLCRSCENNHSIIVEQLANYLPEETDPNYEYLAEHIDDFRRQLEEKYPPVCDNCAPKVNSVIKSIRYDVISKGMARVLVNTEKRIHSNQIAPPRTVSRIMLGNFLVFGWFAWGAAYWASIALLMFWQFTISIFALHTSKEGSSDPRWQSCIAETWQKGNLSSACYDVSSKWVNVIFPWALLLSFYDYKWLEVRRRPGSYVEDRAPYMACQAVVSVFIGLSWWYLGPGGSFKEERKIMVLSHASLLIEALVLWIAFTSLKVTRPVYTISLNDLDRPKSTSHLPPLLVKSSSSLSSSGGMTFRPTGPSINEHINAPRTPPSVKSKQPYINSAKRNQPTPKYTIEPYQPPLPFQSRYATPAPALPPPSTHTTPGQPDPDAMDWNPSFNENDSQDTFNPMGSFSEHRPSSPLGFFDHFDDTDDDDAKTEIIDSPAKPIRKPMRGKTLMVDGMLEKQTGLESLFEVAAKLDEAKPLNQPGILKKRAHRVGQEAARLLIVCSGLFTLVSSDDTTACAGLALAIVFGTGWRFIRAAFRSGNSIYGLGDAWKRNLTILVCLFEACAGAVVAGELLGFRILPQPISLEHADSSQPLLPIDMTPTDTATPFTSEASFDISAPVGSSLVHDSRTQIMQLIIRLLFFSMAAHQTWDFSRVFAYKGTHVLVAQEGQPDPQPAIRRRDSREFILNKPINNFGGPLNKVQSPAAPMQPPPPPPPPPTTTGFGGLSLGGPSGSTLTHRSNFSSWGKRETDVGIQRPTPQRFGATTTRSMKVPPPGMDTVPSPWTQAGFSQTSFQQPRENRNWG
ncbi:hypothetical protein TWF192_001477 [Orbilia oligospora]|uniref:Ima1 N-terminal domain-containing protein n=1 Tax=Orbilia oligospora TaxID=2813651 RepID=A0A6G1MG69_ORBOL|nr:hypothetical protein TWF679_001708 [Orbilia oligospora]KAF3216673.1 hypothetical protein TWF191_008918 [Orbilia oligospora]KAF3257203.1 hypothetical protein TWF192_001477 [Orbilia oligospora]